MRPLLVLNAVGIRDLTSQVGVIVSHICPTSAPIMKNVCTAQVSDASFLEAFQATKGELEDLMHHKVIACLRVLVEQVTFAPCHIRFWINRIPCLSHPRHLQTVTIARLMELAPADPTVSLIDPTPFVYDSTMLMGASLSAGLFLARGIDHKYTIRLYKGFRILKILFICCLSGVRDESLPQTCGPQAAQI